VIELARFCHIVGLMQLLEGRFRKSVARSKEIPRNKSEKGYLMRSLKLILPSLSLTLVSSLMPLSFAQVAQVNAQRDPSGAGTVIFSLRKFDASQPIYMEPIVIISGGKYTAPPIDADDAVTKKFTSTYLRTGRQYRIVFGGGDSGTLTVQKTVQPGCEGLGAEVTVQTTARIGGEVKALAVSSDKIGRGESSRRAPTEAERAAALEVVRVVYGQRGVGAALVRKMQAVNLTAIDIDRDGKVELIGSFNIEGANYLMYSLFVIFEPTAAGKYKAAWNWYHKGAEDAFEDRRLLDAVDLDGDGIAEVIVDGHYYESNDYIIYKRTARVWRPIYKGGGGGC
jgi:hypothetical protein